MAPEPQLPTGRSGRLAGLGLLLAAIGVPMGWAVIYSGLYSLGGIGLLSDGWTLRHWKAAVVTGGLTESLLFSPAVAATVTLLATTAALGVTLLAPQLRSDRVALSLALLLLATPSAVMSLMAFQILSPGGGIARVAFHAGLIASPTQFPVLVNDPYAIGIIVTQFCGSFPLLVLFFLKAWSTARADAYCRLAESLGATVAQARLRVALPLLLRHGRPLILLSFLFNLGSYEVPLLLGRQSPQMFSVLTQRRFGQFDLSMRPQAFALAVSYFVLVAIGLHIYLGLRRRRV